MFFPTMKQEDVRSLSLEPEQAPDSVILGLGPKCTLSSGELRLARFCSLLSLKLFPSTTISHQFEK